MDPVGCSLRLLPGVPSYELNSGKGNPDSSPRGPVRVGRRWPHRRGSLLPRSVGPTALPVSTALWGQRHLTLSLAVLLHGQVTWQTSWRPQT